MKILFSLFIALMITACAGAPFKWDDARQIKEGMTPSEVEQLMGTPTNVAADGDGLVYVWVYYNGLTTEMRTLKVPFKQGKVSQIPQIPDSYK